MEIIPYYDVDVEATVRELAAGKIFIMPTETSYGLVADACNESAVKKIFAMKNRKSNKPLPVIFSSYDQVVEYFQIPESLAQIARQYWPGPLSIAVQPIDNRIKANPSNDFGGTIVARVSSDNLLQDLLKIFKRPLVATSANISGENTIYRIKDLIDVFSKLSLQPDVIIDKGDLLEVEPSTVIVDEHGEVVVVRQGPIKI